MKKTVSFIITVAFALCVLLIGLTIYFPQVVFADPLGIWTLRISGTSEYLTSTTYGNDTFVAVGDNGAIITSPDGVTWTSQISGYPNNLYGITYGNNIFVAVGEGNTLTSPDGVTWTPQAAGAFTNFFAITYGNNTFVKVGGNGTILTSPDTVTWTLRSSGTNQNLNGVTYGNDTFVAVGYNGTITTSPDGVTWTPQASGTDYQLSGITYGNSSFVVSGGSGKIFTSPDGISWIYRVTGVIKSLNDITYGCNTFVTVGQTGTILQSDPLGDQSPSSNAGPDQMVFDEITLDGSMSEDPDGEIVSYQWQIQHRENSTYDHTATGETPTVTNLEPGFYDVTLTVTDNDGLTDSDTMLLGAAGLCEPCSQPYDVSGCIKFNGEPLVNFDVYLKQKGEDKQYTSTDDNGCYEFPSLFQDGPFEIKVKYPKK